MNRLLAIVLAVLSTTTALTSRPAQPTFAASPPARVSARTTSGPVGPIEASTGSRPEVAADFVAPETAWSAGHRGVDLVGRPGDVVHAALAGTVTFAGTVAGRGVVVVDHGTLRTTYEPVAASVHRGRRVTAGAAIGTLELGGSHCLPRSCLHWGLIVAGEYRDPLTLFGLGPVRLLPTDG